MRISDWSSDVCSSDLIRAYVDSVRSANATSDDPACEMELEVWASWALAQADRTDPVRSRKFLIGLADNTDEAGTDETCSEQPRGYALKCAEASPLPKARSGDAVMSAQATLIGR